VEDFSLGYLVTIIENGQRNSIHEALLPYNLTTEQYTVLRPLMDGQTKNQKQLAAATQKDEANIARILRRLETSDRIKRVTDPNDKRSKKVRLTQETDETMQHIVVDVMKCMDDYFSVLSEAEQLIMNRLMTKVIDANKIE
jgi:DNA-binding MarR family transcriptional regulator